MFNQQICSRPLALALFWVCSFIALPQAWAIYYQRGPIERDEYVSTFVEHVSHPRFSKGMFGPYMNNKYEKGAYFYSGLIHKEQAERSAFGTTFWQGTMEDQVRILNTGPLFFPLSSVSEGASTSAGANLPFLLENTWYQLVYKIWQPSKGGNSLFGVWFQEVDKGTWHHALTAQLPVVSKGFSGSGGFLEPLNKDKQVHRMERKNSYAYIHGQGWRSLNQLQVGGGSPDVNNKRYWKILENKEENKQEIFLALKDEKLLPDFNVPHGEKLVFSFEQPEQPSFPKLKIKSATAQKMGSQVLVSWTMPKNAVPSVDARVELLNDAQEVIETAHLPRPYQKDLCFTPQAAFESMRLIVTDLYGQEAVATAQLNEQAPELVKAAAIEKSELAPGVDFQYWGGGRANYEQLADIEKQERSNFGIAPQIDLNIHEGARRKTAFAAKYQGFLNVPEDGIYQFHLRVSDGYRANISGTELISDGESGLNAKVLTMALEKGFHPIGVDFFNSRPNEGYLELEWLRPGQTEVSSIGREYLFHRTEGKPQQPQVELALDDSKAPLITLSLKGNIPEEVTEVRYFASGVLWRKVDEAPFSIEGGAISGTNRYSAKLYYEDGRVWVTPVIEYKSENLLGEGSSWTYEARSSDAPVSYTFTNGTLNYSGRGKHEFFRKVEGDFTLKARINKLEGGDSRSFVALGKRKDRFSLFASTQQGISIPSHQRNFGGGGFAGPAFVEGEEAQAPWLCLANKGGRLTTYYSYDGEIWNKANEAFFERGIDEVSILLESKLSEGEPFLKVNMSEIEWQDEFDPSLEPQLRPSPLELQDQAILGLVAGGGDIAYARTKRGLLKTEDFGKTWFSFPGNSAEKADGIIRSLAVSPLNPQWLLAAEIEDGQSKLLQSKNGGKKWQQIKSPVSFSDTNFSLLSGELIDFHPSEKNLIVLGGQEGVYLSKDGGKSWEISGLEGKPVSFARWHDASLKLNKGFPLYAASPSDNQLVGWDPNNDKRSRKIKTPAAVMDVRFQPADYVSWFYLVTSRGIYETVNGGNKFMQMHAPDPLSLKQEQAGIFDHTITAIALARHSKPATTQRTMVCFRMQNPDPKKPQASYLKGSFKPGLILKENELVLRALDHPTAPDQGILGTDQGLYYTQGNRGLYRGKFEAAKINR